jgi:hypothetical protein
LIIALALTDKEERKKQRKKRVDKLSADSASAANSAQVRNFIRAAFIFSA